MKRIGMIALLFLCSSAQAGMHLGVAKAAAKESETLMEQAADTELRNTTGDNAAQSLPACGSNLPYNTLITDLSLVAAIDPLGHVNPSGHTFPTDHIYFYMKPLDPLNPVGPRQTANVVAPGDITVTAVASTEYLSAHPPYTDYSIYFYACREVKSYVSHIQTLDSAFAAKVGAVNGDCSDYSSGGTSLRRCQKNLGIPMLAGEAIGTSGPPHAVSFDFGTYDMRTNVNFISPQRRFGDNLHTVCPLDYFSSNLRMQMEAIIGRFDGSFHRTVAPVCGEIGYDLANTAKGWWYKPGAPAGPDDPNLALIPDNVDPTRQDFSIGTSVPGFVGWTTFIPVSTGLVDRDFATVAADGNVYCYDSFYDPAGNPGSPGFRILLSMPTSTTVKIERDPSSTTCGAGPFTQSAAAVTFER